MATWFGITATATDQTLPADSRSGQQVYTVTNESGAVIRGDGLIVPDGETKVEWFTIAQPSRVYSADGSEQVAESNETNNEYTYTVPFVLQSFP